MTDNDMEGTDGATKRLRSRADWIYLGGGFVEGERLTVGGYRAEPQSDVEFWPAWTTLDLWKNWFGLFKTITQFM